MGKRELINALIANIDGGREVAAAYLGLSMTAFCDRLYENKGCKFFTVDQLLALQSKSGTALVAEFFAHETGHIVVEAPNATDLDNTDLFERSMRTHLKRGEVDLFIAKALQDNELDPNEVDKLIAVHRKHLAARDEEIRAIIGLYAKQNPDAVEANRG